MENPSFIRTVKVSTPAGDGYEQETLKVTYRALPVDEAKTFDFDDADGVCAFLERVVIGVDDVIGADGKPMPYTDALRDTLINIPYVRIALAQTYFEAIAGARAGN